MRTVPSEPARRRAGFSLVEVTLALLVAAGGLLTIFGVFPVALRQSQMSRSDMGETAFADTVLQTLGGNIRAIDDISVWNDPVKFWAAAVEGTGLPATISDAKNGSAQVFRLHEQALNGGFTGRANGAAGENLSPMATYVASSYSYQNGDLENAWYVAFEREDTPNPPGISELVQPAQFLIRLACIRRNANAVTGFRRTNGTLPTGRVEVEAVGKWADKTAAQRKAFLPNIYQISVVSTDRGFPDVFIREPVFSQEFTFVHRP
jgi:type II secretory pathway component PulJ